MNADPALDALLLPFANGLLPMPADGDALFFGAREGAGLQPWRMRAVRCVQGFKPLFDALQRGGFDVRADADGHERAGCVLSLPPRQREAARAALARAVDACAAGGVVVVAVPNNEGAKSAEADAKRLCGSVAGVLSKYHCRVFWVRPDADTLDAALLAQWRMLDAPRELPGGWTSAPGVFAWDRIDSASALLAGHFPGELAGDIADLGAGWGYLSRQLLARCAGVRSLALFEADHVALHCARINLAGAPIPVTFHWHDVAQGVPGRFDAVVCNPPFHAHDRRDRPGLGQRFIEVAATALKPGGRLWLVANRHLPYEAVLADGFAQVRVHAQRDGFKVVEAVRAR
ncbi:MAG: methyltransferase [Pseudoxanthomonas suwonensis]|nr:methyltransferase [Pseudoxanthomonas suwonensis]